MNMTTKIVITLLLAQCFFTGGLLIKNINAGTCKTQLSEVDRMDIDLLNVEKNTVNDSNQKNKKITFGLYEFFIAWIEGEYNTKTNKSRGFILNGDINVNGFGILYAERQYLFGFHRVKASFLNTDCFLGICENGIIRGVATKVFVYD